MGTRGVAWRRVCPDGVIRQLEEAAGVTLYIVHQTGPTGFILKEDGARKKLKVMVQGCSLCEIIATPTQSWKSDDVELAKRALALTIT